MKKTKKFLSEAVIGLVGALMIIVVVASNSPADISLGYSIPVPTTAYETKGAALSILKGLYTADPQDQQQIYNAMQEVRDSMGVDAGGTDEHAIWLTPNMIDCKFGHKIFDHEKQAVVHLKLVADPALQEGIDKVIGYLLEADRILARAAISESPVGSKATEKAMASYDEAMAGTDPHEIIQDFRMAWKHADKSCVAPVITTTLKAADIADGGDGFTDSMYATCSATAGCHSIVVSIAGYPGRTFLCSDPYNCVATAPMPPGTWELSYYGIDMNGVAQDPANFTTITLTDKCPFDKGPNGGCPVVAPTTTAKVIDNDEDGFSDSVLFTCESPTGCQQINYLTSTGLEGVVQCNGRTYCEGLVPFQVGLFDVNFYGTDVNGNKEFPPNVVTVKITDMCPDKPGPDNGCPTTLCPKECDQTANNYCSHWGGASASLAYIYEPVTQPCPVECDPDCGAKDCGRLPAFCGVLDQLCVTEGCNRLCDIDCGAS